MMRLRSFTLAALLAVPLAACNKPTDEACRKAISNMRTLMGTENLRDNDGVEGEVRRCKGGSSKKSVECAIKATSLDDLRTCDFFKVPENAPGIGGSAAPVGSAGSAGSAMAGSASGSAMGSGSAVGSGSPMGGGSAAGAGSGSAAAAGSAAGSAASGSAAGSAASGSAAGSGAATGSAARGSAASKDTTGGDPAIGTFTHRGGSGTGAGYGP